MKAFTKETGLGTLYSKIKVYPNGTATAFATLNGNDLYQGDFKSVAAAEAHFIIQGYDLFSL